MSEQTWISVLERIAWLILPFVSTWYGAKWAVWWMRVTQFNPDAKPPNPVTTQAKKIGSFLKKNWVIILGFSLAEGVPLYWLIRDVRSDQPLTRLAVMYIALDASLLVGSLVYFAALAYATSTAMRTLTRLSEVFKLPPQS